MSQHLLSQKLTRGSTTIFCIENGDYSTGQAAVDAANSGDTILFGPKSSLGNWGNITIPAGKRLNLVGLGSERNIIVRVGAITYAPTTSTVTNNEVSIANLFIDGGASTTSLTFNGTAVARLRLNNCYINNSTVACMSLINSGTGSSCLVFACTIGGSTSATVITSSLWLAQFSNSTISGSAVTNLEVTGGNTVAGICSFQCNSDTNPVITISGGAFVCGQGSITNSTTNGTGVNISTAGAVFSNMYNYFSVATGTGYCVTGVSGGVHLYGNNIFNDSAAAAGNVKMKNTLTNLPYTTAFTSSG
jgi:hypothetical protein